MKKSVSVVDRIDGKAIINGNRERTVKLRDLKVVSERELRIFSKSDANRFEKLMFLFIAVDLDVTFRLRIVD